MSIAENKLKELGIILPQPPKPIAAYQPGIRSGDLVFTSGQLPMQEGQLMKGKLGDTMTESEGFQAARACAINCMAVLKSIVGDLDRVEQIVKVVGFVNCTPDYEGQPKIINGASELLGQVFGDRGIHSRSAVGVCSLPMGACCEVEIIARIKE